MGKKKTTLSIDEFVLKKAKDDLIILHPLPKNDEIASDIDDEPGAQYFRQAEFGMYIRMALLIKLLESPKVQLNIHDIKNSDKICGNRICVTNTEKNMPDIVKTNGEKLCCAYCETEI